MKVLVVDDTAESLFVTSTMIEELGHDVVLAASGAEAVAAYATERPDLVLLDVVMPELDGYETARRIRALSCGDWIPIVFLSGRVEDEDVARGIEAGGDDYLTKPVGHVMLQAKFTAMQRISMMRHRLLAVSRQLAEANRELERATREDGLTGVANRRHFDEYLAQEWRRAVRVTSPVSLLFADVDHFKAYNDEYGHLAGDACLRQVAAALASGLRRSGDLMARYGGEEFAVVLPETPIEGAVEVAERLRQAVEALAIPHSRSPVARVVTVSLGVASACPWDGDSPEGLLAEADAAQYAAKAGGRNRIVCAPMRLRSVRLAAT